MLLWPKLYLIRDNNLIPSCPPLPHRVRQKSRVDNQPSRQAAGKRFLRVCSRRGLAGRHSNAKVNMGAVMNPNFQALRVIHLHRIFLVYQISVIRYRKVKAVLMLPVPPTNKALLSRTPYVKAILVRSSTVLRSLLVTTRIRQGNNCSSFWVR